jgi:hypothetical protein
MRHSNSHREYWVARNDNRDYHLSEMRLVGKNQHPNRPKCFRKLISRERCLNPMLYLVCGAGFCKVAMRAA